MTTKRVTSDKTHHYHLSPITCHSSLLLRMKRLIVNADDFGFTNGVNKGIVQSYKQGIVTSTTIMANGQAFDEAVELARENPGLGVGCHLSIVGGRPVAPATQIRSLLESDGSLPPTLTRLALKLT